VEQYQRIQGFKILGVFEDHTGGGSARIFYAVHPDGRALVQISSRNVTAHGDETDPRWPAKIFADQAEAHRVFINRVRQYLPDSASVSP